MPEHAIIQQWSTFEICLRDQDGYAGERPFSMDLERGGGPIVKAEQKMLLVQHHGWPSAKSDMRVHKKRGGKSKPAITKADDEDPEIWILRCTPHCWRLYFCVYPDVRQFVYLYATCKKKPKRDQEDSAHARHRLNSIRPGGSGIAKYQFLGDKASGGRDGTLGLGQ